VHNRIPIYLSTGIAALHMYYYFTNVTLSSYESVMMLQIYGFSLNFVSFFIIFFYGLGKILQMFSKSAVNGIPKWQICSLCGCFYALIRRKREVC